MLYTTSASYQSEKVKWTIVPFLKCKVPDDQRQAFRPSRVSTQYYTELQQTYEPIAKRYQNTLKARQQAISRMTHGPRKNAMIDVKGKANETIANKAQLVDECHGQRQGELRRI